MAKVTVELHCTWDSGKVRKGPGETVTMEEREAMPLVEKGFVSLVEKSPAKEPAKVPAPATSAAPADAGTTSAQASDLAGAASVQASDLAGGDPVDEQAEGQAGDEGAALDPDALDNPGGE